MSHRAILAAGGQVTGNIPCYATSTGYSMRGEGSAPPEIRKENSGVIETSS
jgi:hypothetical protein